MFNIDETVDEGIWSPHGFNI